MSKRASNPVIRVFVVLHRYSGEALGAAVAKSPALAVAKMVHPGSFPRRTDRPLKRWAKPPAVVAVGGRVDLADRLDPDDARIRDAWLGGAAEPADLSGGDFSGADLRRADLGYARIGSADFRGADLRGADLTRADLTGSDLSEVDLRGGRLHQAKLYGATFNGTIVDSDAIEAAHEVLTAAKKLGIAAVDRVLSSVDPAEVSRMVGGPLVHLQTGRFTYRPEALRELLECTEDPLLGWARAALQRHLVFRPAEGKYSRADWTPEGAAGRNTDPAAVLGLDPS
jgi:uncharacterized protein YjbI with pentapeptide repeats